MSVVPARPELRSLPVRLPNVTCEAIALVWADAAALTEATAAGVGPRIQDLCDSGVEVAVSCPIDPLAVDRMLAVRVRGAGRLHLCAGSEVVRVVGSELRPVWHSGAGTGVADSLRWLMAEWWNLGIGSGLVLLATGNTDAPPAALRTAVGPRAACVAIAGPGSDALLALLDAQLERRRLRRVPAVDLDPAWTVTVDDRSSLPADAQASLLTVANGHLGLRGDREEQGPSRFPEVIAAGVYDGRAGPALLPGPVWSGLVTDLTGNHERRVLDLRTGVLWREVRGGSVPLRTLRFVSLPRPHAAALRAEGSTSEIQAGPALQPPAPEAGFEHGSVDGARWARTQARGHGAIVAAGSVHQARNGRVRTVERLVAFAADPDRTPSIEEVLGTLDDLREAGFDALLAEHRAAWADRWRDADVTIEGDPEAQLAARFSLFHLMASVPTTGEAPVGARGLTGPAYAGHVFWDADVYMLPPLAATCPPAARSMLEYRVRRLGAARRVAAGWHLAGARFPWESAGQGTDVTPRLARLAGGGVVPIRTGDHEEHITADIAWAAWQYHQWTGDTAFLAGRGRELIVEAARYWAARVRRDRQGFGHLYGVIGPDEYHEPVDDNAYTNVMARWNLRLAARLVLSDATGAASEEAQGWGRVADCLVDNYDAATGRYLQFTGYDRLEPLLVADIAEPPVAADVVLGRKRLAGSQIIKQPDVLLLHHLVPEETAPGSLEPNLDYYGPRTAHGSSLSPAITAALLARAGRLDDALDAFRMAARLDLDDLTGTTSAGLHLATMGGLWQALAHGFLGMRPLDGVLHLDPRLPEAWRGLGMRLRFRGARIGVSALGDRLTVTSDAPVTVQLPGMPAVRVAPPGIELRRTGGLWQEGASS
ncbi:MAG TPA: glycosyl hydrolase family 65 protein [Acidimicrobiia bacterium]|nr:glycosyl hydrolase family 65 protein [Acidimicrobiia bacterium]